jgi:hypothetical protein
MFSIVEEQRTSTLPSSITLNRDPSRSVAHSL